MTDLRSAEHPYHFRRVRDRAIQELLGLVKGIVTDGRVSDVEAEGLGRWLAAHPEAALAWPGDVLHARLARIFADGRLDDTERAELTELLRDAVGATEEEPAGDGVIRLPLTQPPPTVLFDGRRYVFTGTFFYGTRAHCEAAVIERGGRVGQHVTRSTDYLVIGTMPTAAWQFSTHGRKIERAVALIDQGYPIAVIAEEHWVSALRAFC